MFRILDRQSIRTKVLLPVLLSVAITAAIAGLGITALGRVGTNAGHLYSRAAKSLGVFADARDQIGDSDWEIRDYLLVGSASDRASLRTAMSTTDGNLDADLVAFVDAQGGSLDPARTALVKETTAELIPWRAARDQVMSSVDKGQEANARAELYGVWSAGDSNLGTTLDDLYNKEMAAAATENTQAQHTASVARLEMLLGGLLGAVLVVGSISLLTRRYVLRPLGSFDEGISATVAGDSSARIAVHYPDEFGNVAAAFNGMLESLSGLETERATANAEREGHMRERFEMQQSAQESVRRRAQEIIDSTAIAVTSELGGVLEQVGAVRAAASAIDTQVAGIDSLTRNVVSQAAQVDDALGSLTEALSEVGSMTKLIGNVSEQTKLLALNATIEAARAGAAGRGFNVVAHEVKDLAETTARSTASINATIVDLGQRARTMSDAIGSMTESIGGFDHSTAALAQVARDQTTVVGQLDVTLGETIERLANLSTLTDKLEQRQSPRIPLHGDVVVTHAGREVIGSVIDISEGGLGCTLDSSGLQADARVDVRITVDGRTFTEAAQVLGERGSAGEGRLQWLQPSANLISFIRSHTAAAPAGV